MTYFILLQLAVKPDASFTSGVQVCLKDKAWALPARLLLR